MDKSEKRIYTNYNKLTVVWLFLIGSFIFQYCHVVFVGSIVVDGEKKRDISPTNKQSDEEDMIDAFNTKTCGLSDPNYDEHEFVNSAREGQFPWIVSFQIQIPSNVSRKTQRKVAKDSVRKIKSHLNVPMYDLHFCCGSFISDKWILSAAHCFAVDSLKNYFRANKLKVVAGSTKVSSRDRTNQNLTIKRIYYHSSFERSMPVGFDIALVELNERVKFSQKREKNQYKEQNEPFMNTICLPKLGKKYKTNETARIAGWGLSSDKDISSMPSKLLTTDIVLQDQYNCTQKYAKSLKSDRPYKQLVKQDDFLCAGYKNSRDACQSDSGGPLMQYSNGKAVAVGIVSYGIGCAKKGVPGLYTRTSAYINWIKDITTNGPAASVSFKLLEAAPISAPGKIKKKHKKHHSHRHPSHLSNGKAISGDHQKHHKKSKKHHHHHHHSKKHHKHSKDKKRHHKHKKHRHHLKHKDNHHQESIKDGTHNNRTVETKS